jgi:hypothetical protein
MPKAKEVYEMYMFAGTDWLWVSSFKHFLQILQILDFIYEKFLTAIDDHRNFDSVNQVVNNVA